MKRFVEGVDREQGTLFPECLDDWIDEDNPVRVIDVFVHELDRGGLGFGHEQCDTLRLCLLGLEIGLGLGQDLVRRTSGTEHAGGQAGGVATLGLLGLGVSTLLFQPCQNIFPVLN